MADFKNDDDLAHVETSSQVKSPADDVIDFPHEKHVKTFRKVDLHLMPLLMALYLVSNLDRYTDPLFPRVSSRNSY